MTNAAHVKQSSIPKWNSSLFDNARPVSQRWTSFIILMLTLLILLQN